MSRYFWLGTVRQWHWISSAVCLVGMLLFAVTGITLNHAGRIESRPVVTEQEALLPPPLLASLQQARSGSHETPAMLPAALSDWLYTELNLRLGSHQPEWSDEELYIGLPRPGGDAWVSIDLVTGDVLHERTDRGWISYFNDLHKGRNTGAAWSGFIDVFAIACVVFCITGLLLLQRHARHRPTTWPLVGLGLVIPLLLALLFIH